MSAALASACRSPRARGRVLAAAAAVILGAAAGDALSNLDRIRAMPLERRRDLLQTLKDFDALPGQERERIRELDRKILEKPAEERARAVALARRYRLLYDRLSDADRKTLDDTADPSVKLSRAIDFAKAVAAKRPQPIRRPVAAIRALRLNYPAPLDTAHLIKQWLTLDPKVRATIDKETEAPAAANQIRSLAGPVEFRFQPEKVDHDEAVKAMKVLPEDSVKTAKTQTERTSVERYLAQAHFMERFEPREDIDREVLFRFAEALPKTFRARLDSLSPERAQRMLAMWFTLVEANAEDFPPPKPAPGQPGAERKASSPSGGSPF